MYFYLTGDTLEIIYSLSTVISMVVLLYFLIAGKRNGLLLSFAAFQFFIFLWNATRLIQVENGGYQKSLGILSVLDILRNAIYKYNFEFFFISFAALSWLIFSLFFSGSAICHKLLPLILLGIPSAMSYISAFTNMHHHLFFSFNGPGVLFIIHAAIAYSYSIIGTVLMIIFALKKNGRMKMQSILLIIAVIFPLVLMLNGDIYLIFVNVHVPLHFNFDSTPIAFTLTNLIVGIAVFQYRFLNITPIAIKKIVDSIKNPIIAVEGTNKVIYCNEFFRDLYSTVDSNVQKDIDFGLIISELELLIEYDEESRCSLDAIKDASILQFEGEIHVCKPVSRLFSVNIQPLLNKKLVLGKIITFNDITDIAELTAAKERNRIAMNVHDTLGHTMTVLLTLLKVSSITCGVDNEKTREKLLEAIDITRCGLKQLRNSISDMAPNKPVTDEPKQSIHELIRHFEKTGLKVEFISNGFELLSESIYLDTVFRICQEAMTNSLKHGNAKNVSIVLKYTGGTLKLFVTNDGHGCRNIKRGFGLSSMEQRVKSLKGVIKVGSDGEKGFSIYVEIPVLINSADILLADAGG